METKHKVEFFYCGALFDESDTRVVKTKDPEKVVVPEYAFAFSFYDVTEQEATLEDGRAIKYTESKNDDKVYYPGARVMTEKEIVKEIPDSNILVSNMKANKWPKVIKTRMGNFKPYDPDRTIII